MTKSPSKKPQQKLLTYMLIILLLFILSAIVSLVVIFYLPTAGWLSYKSKLVPLSFKYPKDWPISQCSEPILFPQMKIEEVISFEDKCDWMQSVSSIGDITVEKFDAAKDPRKDPNSKPFDKTYSRTLEPIKIGNKTGYFLVIKPTPKIPQEKVYYVVANNLVYTIRLLENTFYKGSKKETTKTFEKILATFQF